MAINDEKQKWFRETDPVFWPGQEFALEIDEILYQQRSKYQDILVFKSKTYGNVLVLDNRIQCTERDEFAYQEMMAFLPLLAHPNPKRVLIIGGGDGGVLREVVKYSQVEQAVLCEIDEDVINVSKKYLPDMAKGFYSPKAIINVGDGFEYLKHHTNEFDVIITDSTAPDGPGEALFQESFFSLMKQALKPPHGIICSQGESMWLDLDLIKKMVTFSRNLFPSVAYAYATTPTYPGGLNGFLICSLDKDVNLKEPINEKIADELDTRYYTADVHRAAFALPAFFRKALDEKQTDDNNIKEDKQEL
ncbi:unnamed protein product [Adineta steineri]|uniref:Spermidine synthase n=1 Tax=Adineta steineri TaxID=433720 RepID=A0A818KSK2_9BILA|nr:unnamed protein product [Adineta steineri]CAF1182793.1 unnamed protein product [Adineta steineri]CAF1207270.1 unnamed protein product [Adineta steineri]CAF3561090.1 unnamed protein product [Adineta steineri]CAF3729382.1 unnamed protein product [Adineta steineri]